MKVSSLVLIAILFSASVVLCQQPAEDPLSGLSSNDGGGVQGDDLFEQFVEPTTKGGNVQNPPLPPSTSSFSSSVATNKATVAPASTMDARMAEAMASFAQTKKEADAIYALAVAVNATYKAEVEKLVAEGVVDPPSGWRRRHARRQLEKLGGHFRELTFKWTMQKARCQGVAVCVQRAEQAIQNFAEQETKTLVYHVFRRPFEWSVTGLVVSALAGLASFAVLGLGVWWSSVGKFSAHVVVSLVFLAVVALFRVTSYAVLFQPVFMVGGGIGALPYVLLRLALAFQILIVIFFVLSWAKVAAQMSETEQHSGWGIFKFALILVGVATTIMLLVTGILGTVGVYQEMDFGWIDWDLMLCGLVLLLISTALLVLGLKVYKYSQGAKYVNHTKLSAFRPVLAAQGVLVLSSLFLLIFGILRGTLKDASERLWPISVLSELFFYGAVITVCFAFFLQSKGRAVKVSANHDDSHMSLLSDETAGLDPSNYDY